MKTVVITGSTRGLGLEMAKQFRRRGYNVVINGMNTDRAENAVSVLKKVQGQGKQNAAFRTFPILRVSGNCLTLR